MMGYPKKGEIYLVNFDPTIGSEVKKKRPALILSNDIHNQYSPLVTVAPLSSNTNKVYPFEVYVPKKSTGLNEKFLPPSLLYTYRGKRYCCCCS